MGCVRQGRGEREEAGGEGGGGGHRSGFITVGCRRQYECHDACAGVTFMPSLKYVALQLQNTLNGCNKWQASILGGHLQPHMCKPLLFDV